MMIDINSFLAGLATGTVPGVVLGIFLTIGLGLYLDRRSRK